MVSIGQQWSALVSTVFRAVRGATTLALLALQALLGLWVVLAAPSARAATYAYTSTTFAYVTPSGTANSAVWHNNGNNPGCTGYPDGDDDWADVTFPSAFSFRFGGTSYTGLRIYSNGILAFPPDVSGFHRTFTSSALPITAASPVTGTGCTLSAVPKNLMVPYWRDIVAGTAQSTVGASVKYELLGTAPNRRFVVTWSNVKLYGQTDRYNFQVLLLEGPTSINNNFIYQYTVGASDGTGASVGVQVSTTDYTAYSFNQAFIDPTRGTAILWYPANQLAGKGAEYRFDESSWTGFSGEVKDISGAAQHASRIGSVTNVTGGKLCRGASYPGNTANNLIDAIATPLTPASKGSVSFWYKSNANWDAGGSNAMLFDATNAAARPFFLMKMASGALRFAMTDNAGVVSTAQTSTAYTFGSGTWHHIAVTWSFSPGTNQTVQQIIVDGVLAATSGSTPFRSTTSGAIASLSTMYLGDNRTSGLTPNNGSGSSVNGVLDEVYIYPSEINATQAAADMALTRPACTTLNHFHIVHSGEVVNCGGAVGNVTIEAHDSTHALISLAGTSMNLSTSTGRGTWSIVNAINPITNTGAANSGNATYVFSGESSIVLGLASTVSEGVNINLDSGGITERSGTASTCVPQDYTFGSSCDSNLSFVDAGYLYDVPNHVSEVAQTVSFKAVKKSDSSAACVPTFANKTRDVTFKCAYQTPSAGTLPVRVGGRALNSANSTTAACDATGQSVTLSFDNLGVASMDVQYADVGRLTLSASETTAGVTMTGTDTFVAAPASFAFSGITASPIKAGDDFSATVSARNNAGAVTPNFGNESPKESANVAFSRYQPTGTGAVNGSFTSSLGPFSNGSAIATMTWSEVGTIDLTASLASGNYLGSGLNASGSTGSTGAAGRFIPHHFDTTVAQGCSAGAFTYSGQAMAAQVSAKNKAGGVTENYDGTNKTSPNFAKAVTLTDGNANAGAITAAAVAASDFGGGVAGANPVFTFTTKQTAPASVKLRATETAADAVSSASFTEGLAAMRSGRARMANGYGSELMDLPLLFRTEYWGGATSGWLLNSADSCTVTTLQFTPVGTDITGFTCVREPTNNSGKGCAAALPVANRKFLEGGVAGIDSNGVAGFAGNFNLWLKAPGATHPGSVDISATVPSWLQFDWKGAGAVNPSARATFGVYKNPLIYRRENY